MHKASFICIATFTITFRLSGLSGCAFVALILAATQWEDEELQSQALLFSCVIHVGTSSFPQHFLYFRFDPQGQGLFRDGFVSSSWPP